jgi:hypothetical protein
MGLLILNLVIPDEKDQLNVRKLDQKIKRTYSNVSDLEVRQQYSEVSLHIDVTP